MTPDPFGLSKPTGGCWVPLESELWGWKAKANIISGNWTIDWRSTSNYTTGFAPTSVFPQWDGIITLPDGTDWVA
jgi:hypothetical protein